MATGLITQGTQLFKVQTATTSIEVTNITSFNPPSPNSDEIDKTSLTSTAKEFLQGLRDYGEASFEMNWDPIASANHQQLQADFDAGTTREWIIGFSDGTSPAPTVTASAFGTPATTRTWVKFTGFIKAIPMQGATNDLVKSTLTVRASGTPTYYYKV